MKARAFEAFPQGDPLRLRQNVMIAHDLGQSVEGNTAGQMVDVMHADVARQPAQRPRQVIVGAAVKGRVLHGPIAVTIPDRILELVLDIEQPHADDRREEYGGQENEQHDIQPAEPEQATDNGCNRKIGALRADPVAPAPAHDTDGQAVLQEEGVERHDAEKEQRVAHEAVAHATDPAFFAVFPHRQRWQIAGAPMVEVAGGGMVHRVVAAPDVVRRKGQHADAAPDPIADLAVLEKRAVAAIVLDHEKAHEECRIGHCQRQRQPGADRQGKPGQGPDYDERRKGYGDLEHALRVVWFAVFCKNACPLSGLQ
mmetsp:Transcript_6990/g.12203  ORF Transcript_6990/g.12203 Transcript_6990/m.12203 type:complete len:312 (+) Transcript_6990:150-1085(+)